MKRSYTEIEDEINDLWRASAYVASSDDYYWTPTRKEVETLIADAFISDYIYIKELMDCDDFALILHAFVVQTRNQIVREGKIPLEEQYAWPFGEIWLTHFQGVATPHGMNFVVTSDEGLLLVEPQTDQIFVPSSVSDRPFLIKF